MPALQCNHWSMYRPLWLSFSWCPGGLFWLRKPLGVYQLLTSHSHYYTSLEQEPLSDGRTNVDG